MTPDPSRRADLQRARATALLRTCFDIEPARHEISEYPFGVTVSTSERAWVVSMSDDLAVLGGVLAWSDRAGPAQIDLVVDHHGGVHARRVTALAPDVSVWSTDGDRVVAAVPEPLSPVRDRPDDAAHLEAVLREAGLEVICEDGILRGELAGLEVARIVHGPDGAVLEAGIGRFDREAGALLHAGRAPDAALAAAIEQVGPHRVRGAVSHAINRIGRERWLRSEIRVDPTVAGVVDPIVVEPIPPRLSLLDDAPAALLGSDEGNRVLVVCSVGSDLGLVPAIADLVLAHDPAEVRIVVPPRDRLPHLERLAARLPCPTTVHTMDPPWVD